MRPPKLLRTVYLRAIEVLRARGWHKSPTTKGKGPCCVLVAINIVQRGTPQAWPMHGWPNDPAYNLLRDTIPEHPAAIGDWNDDPKRTKREVIAALRKAAKAAGNKRAAP